MCVYWLPKSIKSKKSWKSCRPSCACGRALQESSKSKTSYQSRSGLFLKKYQCIHSVSSILLMQVGFKMISSTWNNLNQADMFLCWDSVGRCIYQASGRYFCCQIPSGMRTLPDQSHALWSCVVMLSWPSKAPQAGFAYLKCSKDMMLLCVLGLMHDHDTSALYWQLSCGERQCPPDLVKLLKNV